jgi:hypothetical protein
MVVMFVGQLCSGRLYFPYYSYHKNPTGREFFVPAQTLMGIPVTIAVTPSDKTHLCVAPGGGIPL